MNRSDVHQEVVKYLSPVVVSALIIISCLGNGTVIYILNPCRRHKSNLASENSRIHTSFVLKDSLTSKNSVTGIFLLNLAFTDILTILICAPVTILVDFILEDWPFGAFYCYTSCFLQSLVTYLGGITHLTISFDRLTAVCWPMKRRKYLTLLRARIVILFLWLISAVFAGYFTSIINHKTLPDQPFNKTICQEDWEGSESMNFYNHASGWIIFFLPLIIMTGTYTAILCKVWSATAPGVGNAKREEVRSKTKKKLIKMTILVALLFAILRSPVIIIQILMFPRSEQKNSEPVNPLFSIFWIIALCMNWSSTCVNPFIYAWMNRGFRHGLYHAFSCCVSISFLVKHRSSKLVDNMRPATSKWDNSLKVSKDADSHAQCSEYNAGLINDGNSKHPNSLISNRDEEDKIEIEKDPLQLKS